MSITRQEIAEALSKIEGLTGTPLPPRTPGQGQAWPEWSQTRPRTLLGDEITWEVFAALPSGSLDATVLEADKLVDQLIEELETLGEIQTVEPATIAGQQGGSQGLPVIKITLTTV